MIYNYSAGEAKFLCECALKVFNGNIPFSVDHLLTSEKELKFLCNAKSLDKKKRRNLTSNKGIKSMQEISCRVYSYLTEWPHSSLC